MMTKDIRTLSVTLSIIVMMIHNSYEKPVEEPITKEHRICLLECLTCVELWGSMYNAPACANLCSLTNGKSIDSGCKQGTNVVKRYQEIKAKDQCKKQCMSCAANSRLYEDKKCLESCEISAGLDRDYDCSHFSPYYDLDSIFGRKRQ